MKRYSMMALVVVLAFTGCATQNTQGVQTTTPGTTAPRRGPSSSTRLLAPWVGAYGGVPPFDKVRVEDMKGALEAAMVENLAEVERIANNPAAPTFENTIVALERSGRTLDRVGNIYGIWSSTMNGPE